MPTLANMLDELKKYGALRRQFQVTGNWELRKALVLQEAVFMQKAIEFEEAHPGLSLFPMQSKEKK
jgi:hypothetical protein